MPCYIVASIKLERPPTVLKALDSLGIKYQASSQTIFGANFSYDVKTQTFTSRSQAFVNQVKQHYGAAEAETQARMKGFRIQRKTTEDGSIELTLSR